MCRCMQIYFFSLLFFYLQSCYFFIQKVLSSETSNFVLFSDSRASKFADYAFYIRSLALSAKLIPIKQ